MFTYEWNFYLVLFNNNKNNIYIYIFLFIYRKRRVRLVTEGISVSGGLKTWSVFIVFILCSMFSTLTSPVDELFAPVVLVFFFFFFFLFKIIIAQILSAECQSVTHFSNDRLEELLSIT